LTSNGYPHISILATAWLTADILMPLLIRASRRLRCLDHPYGHKTHQDPTPVLGGLGIYVAVVSVLSFTYYFGGTELIRPVLGIIIGGTMVMLLGIIDDIRPINAVIKLAALTAATLLISRFGVCISIFPGREENLLNLLITLLWIVGVTSATNSLDHANGATAGSVAIACGTIFIIAWGHSAATSQAWLSYLSVAIAGGCAGFLRHNLRGGRIFLGDNGSFLLGFLMASSLVFANWSQDLLKALILPCVVLTVPLFDITLSTVLRIKNRQVRSIQEAITFCGKDHIVHRLTALGLSPRAAILAIYSIGVVSGAFAIAIKGLDSRASYLAVTAAYLTLLVILGAVLDRARVHPTRRPKKRTESPGQARARWRPRTSRKRPESAKKVLVGARGEKGSSR